MSKLIYTKSKKGFETAFSEQDRATKIFYSLVFIEEGYFWTQGHYFNLFNTKTSLLTATKNKNNIVLKSSNNDEVTFDIGLYDATSESPITTSITEGVLNIKHSTVTTNDTSVGPNDNSLTTIFVPQLIFDKYGHLKSATNKVATLNKVHTSILETDEIVFVTGSQTSTSSNEELKKSSTISFNKNGELFVEKLYENGKDLSTKYAPYSHINVIGGTEYGHVKLSDSTNDTSNASSGIAATPKAVKEVYEYAKTLAGSVGEAMTFKGVIVENGNIQGKDTFSQPINSLNTYSAGWTFKVSTAQNLIPFGNLEAGDVLIAINDSSGTFNGDDWTVVQADIDGAVTSVNNLSNNSLVVGSGNKTIKEFPLGSNNQFLAVKNGALKWESLAFKPLSIKLDNIVKATYNPTENQLTSINFTKGFKITNSSNSINIEHLNNVAPQSSLGLRKISYDAQGHITNSELITSLPTGELLTFSGSDKSTQKKSFDGSSPLEVRLTALDGITLSTIHTTNGIDYQLSASSNYRGVSYVETFNGTLKTLLEKNSKTNLTIAPGNANISIKKKSDGRIDISSINTWRNVTAYQLLSGGSQSFGTVLSNTPGSINTSDLQFGSEFLWADTDNSEKELKLGWAIVDDAGNITYAV